MKKGEIIKNYNYKLKELLNHNKLYYDKSKPIISDSKYDKLKYDILELENKYKFLKNNKSPDKVVGYKPSRSFEKYKHKVPMLSLSNAFSENDLINFEKKNI